MVEEEPAVILLSNDDPFKKKCVSQKIIELLKEYYPGRITELGVRVHARNMHHYAIAGKLSFFLEKFWSQFTASPSDVDNINRKLVAHCNQVIPKLLSDTCVELAKIYRNENNIPYNLENGLIRRRCYYQVGDAHKDRIHWLKDAFPCLVDHWASRERKYHTKIQSAGASTTTSRVERILANFKVPSGGASTSAAPAHTPVGWNTVEEDYKDYPMF